MSAVWARAARTSRLSTRSGGSAWLVRTPFTARSKVASEGESVWLVAPAETGPTSTNAPTKAPRTRVLAGTACSLPRRLGEHDPTEGQGRAGDLGSGERFTEPGPGDDDR